MTGPRTAPVTAIIPHYFEERVSSLFHAIQALQTGTVRPAEIIIWDNTGRLSPMQAAFGATLQLVRSPKNLGPAARFLAVHLVDPAHEYVFFQDNDVTVAPTTLADLLDAIRNLGGVTTVEGRIRRSDRSYCWWPKLYGKDAGSSPAQKVDVALGRADLVDLRTLQHILLRDLTTPGLPEMDDLAFSAACRRRGVPIRVIPTAALGNHQAGVGMCHDADYHERRDAAAAALNWGGVD